MIWATLNLAASMASKQLPQSISNLLPCRTRWPLCRSVSLHHVSLGHEETAPGRAGGDCLKALPASFLMVSST